MKRAPNAVGRVSGHPRHGNGDTHVARRVSGGNDTFLDRRSALARLAAILPLATALLLSGPRECEGAPFDSLLGSFGLIEHGALVEFARIEQRQQKYLLYRKHTGRWLAPVEVEPITRAQLEAMIKQPMTAPFEGLGNDRLAVLKVPKGWKIGSFVCNSGYWAATVLGPAELQKL